MSPAVSTAILLGVTIVLSLAVGAWLQDITTGYMRIELMSLDDASATSGAPGTITAYIRNSGKDSIYLDKAYVSGVEVVDLGSLELQVDLVTIVTITSPTLALGDGNTYEVKIVSTGGTQLVFSVRAD